MLSVLAARFGTSAQSLAAAHPHSWFVWEPGAWHAPRKEHSTVIMNTARRLNPVAGEALALALEAPPQGSKELLLGRMPASDLVINDATLSGRHLALFCRDGVWSVRDVGSKNGTWVDSVRLVPGQPVLLKDGARVEAGDVLFTFLSPDGMAARLARMLAGMR